MDSHWVEDGVVDDKLSTRSPNFLPFFFPSIVLNKKPPSFLPLLHSASKPKILWRSNESGDVTVSSACKHLGHKSCECQLSPARTFTVDCNFGFTRRVDSVEYAKRAQFTAVFGPVTIIHRCKSNLSVEHLESASEIKGQSQTIPPVFLSKQKINTNVNSIISW